jgi:predicted enzyme related to lactoylglutathione lyase
MPTSSKPFVWYELMTTDPEAAEGFYRAVVGWGAQAWEGPGQSYTLMSAGEATVAGLMPISTDVREAGGKPAWFGYIGVEDVDAATDSVTRAGGDVHRAPADIPDVGRFAVLADPQGATFMLFTPFGGERPPVAPMTPGHVGWHELRALDGPKAFDFYAGQFGWTKADALDMGSMGIYQLFAAGGAPIGGLMNKPDSIPRPFWLFYFIVPGADAAAARVTAAGGQILAAPHQVPGGGWIVHCMDPQGAMFALVAPGR